MKLSGAANAKGKPTELWKEGAVYDQVFSSKVFTFTDEPVENMEG
jgi:hypothetical protein